MTHRLPSPSRSYSMHKMQQVHREITRSFDGISSSINSLDRLFSVQKFPNGGTLTKQQNGRISSNEGAVDIAIFNLPPVVERLRYGFVVLNNAGIRIIASGTDAIRLGTEAAQDGGSVQSTGTASALFLVGFTGGWVALSQTGVWTHGFHFDMVSGNLTLDGKANSGLVVA